MTDIEITIGALGMALNETDATGITGVMTLGETDRRVWREGIYTYIHEIIEFLEGPNASSLADSMDDVMILRGGINTFKAISDSMDGRGAFNQEVKLILKGLDVIEGLLDNLFGMPAGV